MSQPNIPTISHSISGQATTGTSARRQHVTNPATGQVTGQVCLANVADVGAAVAAAKAAFPAWSNTPPLRLRDSSGYVRKLMLGGSRPPQTPPKRLRRSGFAASYGR